MDVIFEQNASKECVSIASIRDVDYLVEIDQVSEEEKFEEQEERQVEENKEIDTLFNKKYEHLPSI